jgi:hypothetical protein
MATEAVFSDSMSLLVKPEIAQAQIERKEKKKAIISDPSIRSIDEYNNPHISNDINPPVVKPKVFHRFYGKVSIDATRAGRDSSKVAEEVISQFTSKIGTKVKVTLHIEVEMDNGADEKLIRDVSENCKSLHFDVYDFEE